MSRWKNWLIPIIGITLIGGLITFYISTTTKTLGQSSRPFSELGGDFRLDSAQGEIALSDFKEHVVVLYFGYLSCADVCPNSMTVMSNAFSKLNAEQKDFVQGLFISVDPARDTVKNLAKYTAYFDENILGATGTKEVIKATSEQYGVFYDLEDLGSEQSTYSVEHASRFYIIDKTGKLITAMSHTTTPNELAAQIKELL